MMSGGDNAQSDDADHFSSGSCVAAASTDGDGLYPGDSPESWNERADSGCPGDYRNWKAAASSGVWALVFIIVRADALYLHDQNRCRGKVFLSELKCRRVCRARSEGGLLRPH